MKRHPQSEKKCISSILAKVQVAVDHSLMELEEVEEVATQETTTLTTTT
jgi:hypothetical protein